ncbi:hypothetical protein EK21DRAFT_114823 [Setomelanomma holmii]|uniref:Uncharacterized protein n=1 Tax=Setomelanomma holmii TaxID=210430 RepID=A0A9P4LJR1_9PLEO|nr:hypothetical protein EK21DRAFT_114823 [Setomelanomma holmii]
MSRDKNTTRVMHDLVKKTGQFSDLLCLGSIATPRFVVVMQEKIVAARVATNEDARIAAYELLDLLEVSIADPTDALAKSSLAILEACQTHPDTSLQMKIDSVLAKCRGLTRSHVEHELMESPECPRPTHSSGIIKSLHTLSRSLASESPASSASIQGLIKAFVSGAAEHDFGAIENLVDWFVANEIHLEHIVASDVISTMAFMQVCPDRRMQGKAINLVTKWMQAMYPDHNTGTFNPRQHFASLRIPSTKELLKRFASEDGFSGWVIRSVTRLDATRDLDQEHIKEARDVLSFLYILPETGPNLLGARFADALLPAMEDLFDHPEEIVRLRCIGLVKKWRLLIQAQSKLFTTSPDSGGGVPFDINIDKAASEATRSHALNVSSGNHAVTSPDHSQMAPVVEKDHRVEDSSTTVDVSESHAAIEGNIADVSSHVIVHRSGVDIWIKSAQLYLEMDTSTFAMIEQDIRKILTSVIELFGEWDVLSAAKAHAESSLSTVNTISEG